MTITITEQEYQELMRIKREYDNAKLKISSHINTIRNDELVAQLTSKERETQRLIIRLLEELLK